MNQSPWWYRRRDAVFGIIYGFGFFTGGLVSGIVNGRYTPLYKQFGTPAIVAILLLMIGCYAVRLWGSSYLHARIVWSDNARADSLIVAGPFRFTRNPLYLGNVLMALGLGAFAPLPGWIAINVLNIAFVAALIHVEESGLLKRYGAQFEDYRASVPVLFPSLRPARAAGAAQASIKEGFRSEIFIGSLLLGTIALLASPGAIGWSVFAVLYLAGIVLQGFAAGRAECGPQPT